MADPAALRLSLAEEVEAGLSDKVLTLLKRSTEDVASPPPHDALAGLTMSCAKQSDESAGLTVEWFRQRLQTGSTLVKHSELPDLPTRSLHPFHLTRCKSQRR